MKTFYIEFHAPWLVWVVVIAATVVALISGHLEVAVR